MDFCLIVPFWDWVNQTHWLNNSMIAPDERSRISLASECTVINRIRLELCDLLSIWGAATLFQELANIGVSSLLNGFTGL
jgi:hypothetical protein